MDLHTADPGLLAECFETFGAGVIVFDIHARHGANPLYANRMLRVLYGLETPVDNAPGHDWPPDLIRAWEERAQECARQRLPIDIEEPLPRKGKADRWQRMRMIPVFADEKGSAVRVFVTVADITEKRRLEQGLQVAYTRLRSIVDSSHEGIITIDRDQRIKTINEAALHIFGYSADALVGQTIDILIPARFHARHPGYVRQFQDSDDIARPMESRVEVTGRRKDGSEFMAEVTIAKVEVGTGLEFAAFVRDVSEHMRLIDELHVRATTDPLTGLYNRRHIIEEAAKEMSRAMRFSHPASLVLIDLDDFKGINDAHGHHVGDKVLRKAASVCHDQTRQSDILARWGGEEFLLLLPETESSDAMELAERILRGIRGLQEHVPELGESRITASIGITTHRHKGDRFEDMIHRADQAMYEAKQGGKDQAVVMD